MTKATKAVQTALNSLSKTIGDDNFESNLRTEALKNLQVLMADSSSQEEENLQTLLIEGLIAGVIVMVMGTGLYGYNHSRYTEQVRKQFDQEIKEQKVTFILPDKKNLSPKQTFIKNVIHLLNTSIAVDSAGKQLSFADFSGLIKIDNQNSTLVILISTWALDKLLESSITDRRPLQVMRRDIEAFLITQVTKELNQINQKYEDEYFITSFFKSMRSSYLDDIRAARFLVICLANILSKARCPRDKLDLPLSVKENIEFCRRLGILVNELLKSIEAEIPPMTKNEPSLLENFNFYRARLISYLRDIEIEASALRDAYVKEYLNEFSLKDIVNSAYYLLETLNEQFLNLIYRQTISTRDLYQTMGYLRNIFQKNPHIMDCFATFNPALAAAMDVNAPNRSGIYKKLDPKELCINTPPLTVIDTLILFFHMTTDHREKFIKKLLQSKKSSEKEFAETLRYCDKHYLQPITAMIRIQLDAKYVAYDDVDLARYTAQRVLPIMTLAFQSREEGGIDTDYIVNEIAKTPHLQSGAQQIKAINRMALIQSKNPNNPSYYPYIDLDLAPTTKKALNDLRAHQVEFLEIYTLLGDIHNVLDSNRCMFQQKNVFEFIQKYLQILKSKTDDNLKILQSLMTDTLNDEEMTRHWKSRINQMIDSVEKRLEHLKIMLNDVKQQINLPNFVQCQREIFIAQIQVINRKYMELFGESAGLENISFSDSHSHSMSSLSSVVRSENKSTNTTPLPQFTVPTKTFLPSFYMQVIATSLLAAGFMLIIIGALGLNGIGAWIGFTTLPALITSTAGGASILVGNGLLLASSFWKAAPSQNNENKVNDSIPHFIL